MASFSRTNRMVKTILDFNEARDDGVVVASAGPCANYLYTLHTDNHTNHTSTSPLNFLQAGCSSDAQPTVSKYV